VSDASFSLPRNRKWWRDVDPVFDN
jgi:hypothetical protein